MGRNRKKNPKILEQNHLFYYRSPEEEKQYEVQEGLYIPIEKRVNKDEKLKLIFNLEGKLSSDMGNALYLAINLDGKRELFDDRDKLEEEWNLLYNNLENFP